LVIAGEAGTSPFLTDFAALVPIIISLSCCDPQLMQLIRTLVFVASQCSFDFRSQHIDALSRLQIDRSARFLRRCALGKPRASLNVALAQFLLAAELGRRGSQLQQVRLLVWVQRYLARRRV